MTDDEAYDVLGLIPGASPNRVTAKYKELAWKVHPDRGGEAGAFARLAEAHSVALVTSYAWPCETCKGAGRSAVKIKTGFGSLADLMCGTCVGSGKKW
jgi:DnaJ-class molecular chaperone